MAGLLDITRNPNAIATVVAARALAPLRNNTVAFQVSNQSYANEIRSFGDTVNVPIPAEFSTNLMADGGTITRQNPTLGNAALVLNKHREISMEITDVNSAFATPNLQNVNAGQALANFAEDVDADFLGIYAQFTTTDVGSYNPALTEAVIDSAETTLFNQRVPESDVKSLIVTGGGYSALRQIARFTEAEKRPGADAASSRIMGQLKGFNVYRSQGVNITNTNESHGIAMGPNALLTAIRPLGTGARMDGTIQVEMWDSSGISIRMTWSYHHETLGGLTTLDMLYGFVSGRTTHGVEVRH